MSINNTPTRGLRRVAPSILVGIAAFVLYQTTFAGTFQSAFMDFWLLGSDNYRITMTQLQHKHAMAIYQSKKHPLFAVTGIPLYEAGRLVYGGQEEPRVSNLAFVFPVALVGGLNAALAVEIFRTIGFGALGATGAGMLYAIAASIWLLTSIPESYALTNLMTNLFLWAFLVDPTCRRRLRLPILQGLACFAAPQQVLLALIPGVAFLRRLGLRDAIKRGFHYALALGLFWGVPFVLILTLSPAGKVRPHSINFARNELVRWADPMNLVDPANWALVGSTFVGFSQAIPLLDPREPIAWGTVALATPASIALAVVLGIYVLVGAQRALRRGPRDIVVPLAAFVLLYLSFLVYYNPGESLLHAAPVVLPIWLVAHLGFRDRQEHVGWRIAVAIGIVATILANGAMVSEMTRHATWGERVLPYPPGVAPAATAGEPTDGAGAGESSGVVKKPEI